MSKLLNLLVLSTTFAISGAAMASETRTQPSQSQSTSAEQEQGQDQSQAQEQKAIALAKGGAGGQGGGGGQGGAGGQGGIGQGGAGGQGGVGQGGVGQGGIGQGGIGQGGAGGNAQSGDISNQIKTQFSSFVAGNAPQAVGTVSGCLAALGGSWSVGFMGNDGISLSRGSKPELEFSEQCAAVEVALQVFANPGTDYGAKLFALNLMVQALGAIGEAAKAQTMADLRKFAGKPQPNSIVGYWLEPGELPNAVPPAATAVAPARVPVNEVHYYHETVTQLPPKIIVKKVKVNPDGTPYVEPCKPCAEGPKAK